MTTVQRPVTFTEPVVDTFDALASVYDETAARVYGVVLRVVRDPAQAAEVTQEVYLELWLQIARYDTARGSPVARLMTIARFKAMDRLRRVEASRRREVVDFVSGLPVGGCDVTSEVADRLQNEQVVRVAIACLTVSERQAIEMSCFGGHSHAQVARLLGIPLATVEDRIKDGLIKLRLSIVTREIGSRVWCG